MNLVVDSGYCKIHGINTMELNNKRPVRLLFAGGALPCMVSYMLRLLLFTLLYVGIGLKVSIFL